MNDLDFRAPEQRPAPERLRHDIEDRLAAAAQPGRRTRWLVAAVLVLVLVGGAAFVASQLPARPPAPASGPVGTLDVGRVGEREADAQLDRCLAAADPDVRAQQGWTVRYARLQHLDGRDPAHASAVLWAQSGDVLLGCTDGADPSTIRPATPDAGGAADRASLSALVEEAVPTPSCQGQPPADPAVALLQVGQAVRTARVRLVVDGRPRAWQTTGVDGALASVPVLDPDDFTTLAGARSLAYELQTLDQAGGVVPIATLASSSGVPTYRMEIPTCADEAGVAEHPATRTAGEAECLRLVAAATGLQDDRRTARTTFSGPGRFASVVGTEQEQWLCSLEPTRGVRSINALTTPDARSSGSVEPDPLSFSAVDRGARGVVLWAGGRLRGDVAAITYTWPDGRTVPAVLGDGFWTLSDSRDHPFLDGRPLDQLRPAEVVVTATDGSQTRSSVTFPGPSGCDSDLVLPAC